MANLYVFHQGGGGDGQLHFAVFDGASWSADIGLDIALSESPGAVAWADGISVFHQGLNFDAKLHYTFSPDGQNWGGDTLVPAVAMLNSPAPVVAEGVLNVFHQTFGPGQLGWAIFNGTSWSADLSFPPTFPYTTTDSPSAVVYNGNLYVFYQGANGSGQLWYVVGSGTGWSLPTLVPVLALSYRPSAVAYNGLLYLFHQGGAPGGTSGDGQLRYTVFDGTNWSADIPLNIAMSHAPSAVAWAGGISVFHQGPNFDGQLYYTFSPDGQHWVGDTLVPVLALTFSPSCVVY
jgi:hypothetical protein